MLAYLLQSIACSGILYGYYHFFLRDERFHQYNRFYLLFSIAVSLLLPLVKIPVVISNVQDTDLIYAFVSTGENVLVTAKPGFDYALLLYALYFLIVGFLVLKLVMAVLTIVKIKREASPEIIESITFLQTAHPDAPFSFFKWLFWRKSIPLDSKEGHYMFRHECYHIRNK